MVSLFIRNVLKCGASKIKIFVFIAGRNGCLKMKRIEVDQDRDQIRMDIRKRRRQNKEIIKVILIYYQQNN